MQRRDALKSIASTAAGLTILKSGMLVCDAPSNKLNIALMGVWGGAQPTINHSATKMSWLSAMSTICAPRRPAAFPGAKTYYDWRKCLEQKDIEDKWSSARRTITMLSSPTGQLEPRYARVLREAARNHRGRSAGRACELSKRKAKVATQHGRSGTRIRTSRGARIDLDGAIGDLEGGHSWTPGTAATGISDGQGMPPSGFHYGNGSAVTGPSVQPAIFRRHHGLNCLFGTCTGTLEWGRWATWAATLWTWCGAPSDAGALDRG